jgi:hypothetical protein
MNKTGFGLLALVLLAASNSSAEDRGYWTDPATGLEWATADNGSGVSWSQATRYCRELTVGAFNDWTLPSIDELQHIFGGAENEDGRHIRGPIRLTGWAWSSTDGEQPGEGWAFDFGDGARASVAAGDSGLNRALCVRSPHPTRHGRSGVPGR